MQRDKAEAVEMVWQGLFERYDQVLRAFGENDFKVEFGKFVAVDTYAKKAMLGC